MALNTVQDIIDAKKQVIDLVKYGTASGTFLNSTWVNTPRAGATPPLYTAGAGYTCDNNTVGNLFRLSATISNRVAKLEFSNTFQGTLILVDRLWSCSGMGFAAGTYTVTTPGALPTRAGNGIGVEAYVENFVATGAASGSLTLNYIDHLGAAKVGSLATVANNAVITRLQPIALAAGGQGISQVTSVVTSNTWTSGTFGITLMKRLLEVPLSVAGGVVELDWSETGLVEIPNDACLSMIIFNATSGAPNIYGTLTLIDA